MAKAAQEEASDLVCPLIDARRMEVFTAIFDKNLIEIMPPLAMILHENSFESILATHQILFFGSGSNKLKGLVKDKHARFADISISPYFLASFAYNCFQKKNFTELAYSEPFYLKDFHSSTQ
jgi:tRNA threonylcarbamoyladenosine biosynthesis protein TsaB